MSQAGGYGASRQPGLAVATQLGSHKLHIVTLEKRPYPDEEARLDLWAAESLCKSNARYYWRPTHPDNVEERTKCVQCFMRWRRRGQPAVQGLTIEPAKDGNLPTGWREVEPAGHPRDAGVEDDDEHPPRKELRRWVRGHRYVRITKTITEKPEDSRCWVHVGWVGQDKTDDKNRGGGLDYALKVARKTMALGGHYQ